MDLNHLIMMYKINLLLFSREGITDSKGKTIYLLLLKLFINQNFYKILIEFVKFQRPKHH